MPEAESWDSQQHESEDLAQGKYPSFGLATSEHGLIVAGSLPDPENGHTLSDYGAKACTSSRYV